MKVQRGISVLVSIFSLMLWANCTPKPQEISYGADGCHFCRMTIVDAQHAAQLVTKKGKVFKFDAIECMLNHMETIDSNTVALKLCNHYNQPQELIDATEATFLISKGIPSPMGAYLTAFTSRERAQVAQKEHEGKLYTWNELLFELNP
nr:nitrous oxide reductase accessory protein NosL [Allomuricauda sp.]